MTEKIPYFAALRFAGQQTSAFLQGQLTCDVSLLAHHGDASLGACCDHRGRMIASFWVIRWEDYFLLLLPATMLTLVETHLKKYAVFSKVTLTNVSDQFFASALYDGDHEKPAATHKTSWISLPDSKKFLILTTDHNPLPTVEITDNDTQWKKTLIENKLCLLYPETSLLFTPQMINLEKLGGVSFSKGCYVGQEIIYFQ